MSDLPPRIDMLIPPEMAAKAEDVGVKKASTGWRNMFLLAILAGAYISLGAIFATTVTAGTAQQLPYGVVRLLGGFVFCLGLILVIVGGAELFTGNNLIIMAWSSRKISTFQLLRNWVIVYFGNLMGSLMTAMLMLYSGQYMFSNGLVGLNILNIATAKCSLDFTPAIILGIMCNALVCMAVWLSFSARTTTDKILSIIFPITAFVAAGFEHCVANMYFIPIGIMVKMTAPPVFWTAIDKTIEDYTALTWKNFFLMNLVPVSFGNIIGGAVLVGLVYWFIYIRQPKISPF
ncbi:MAG: formate transporter FocA [Thermodesulfobacteriota bacterium]|nr:formate transporter FocA [Thermodesulfobacteriota bacterium]